jgi:hypothetical protein
MRLPTHPHKDTFVCLKQNPRSMQKISLAIVFVCVIAATSCSPGKMVVSDSLKQGHDEYEVTGRQGILIKQKMRFGDFYTTSIKRSWTRGGSYGWAIGKMGPTAEDFEKKIAMEYTKKKQTISFELSDGKNSTVANCVSQFNAKDLVIGNPNSILSIGIDMLSGKPQNTYYVQIFTKEADHPWEMLIDNDAAQLQRKTYTGLLSFSKEKYYTIVPMTQLEKNGKAGTVLGSVGFEFRDREGKAVAAVSLIDKGMVFLGKTTPEERLLLANACTALLLQEAIG